MNNLFHDIILNTTNVNLSDKGMIALYDFSTLLLCFIVSFFLVEALKKQAHETLEEFYNTESKYPMYFINEIKNSFADMEFICITNTTIIYHCLNIIFLLFCSEEARFLRITIIVFFLFLYTFEFRNANILSPLCQLYFTIHILMNYLFVYPNLLYSEQIEFENSYFFLYFISTIGYLSSILFIQIEIRYCIPEPYNFDLSKYSIKSDNRIFKLISSYNIKPGIIILCKCTIHLLIVISELIIYNLMIMEIFNTRNRTEKKHVLDTFIFISFYFLNLIWTIVNLYKIYISFEYIFFPKKLTEKYILYQIRPSDYALSENYIKNLENIKFESGIKINNSNLFENEISLIENNIEKHCLYEVDTYIKLINSNKLNLDYKSYNEQKYIFEYFILYLMLRELNELTQDKKIMKGPVIKEIQKLEDELSEYLSPLPIIESKKKVNCKEDLWDIDHISVKRLAKKLLKHRLFDEDICSDGKSHVYEVLFHILKKNNCLNFFDV